MATAPALGRTSVPKVTPWFDLRTLRVDAREGFFVSRIDGYTTLGDLATMTGQSLEDAVSVTEKLIGLLVVYVGDQAPAKPVPPEEKPKTAPPAPPKPQKKRARRWSDGDLAAESDLDPELRADVLDLHTWLDDLDHYELLGLERDADRKGVKAAYYKLAARFHTDRYYGKNLGTFKPKMEQIFGRITTAHDTLASKPRRAEYDLYLVDLDRTRAFEAYLKDEPPAEPEAAPEASPVPAVVAPTPPPPASSPQASPDDRARREALARKLSGRSSMNLRAARAVAPTPSNAPPPMPTVAPKVEASPEQSRAAGDALRRRFEDGRDHARKTQARKLIDEAAAAMERGDVLAAANNYRLAVRYTDDPIVHEAAELASQRARDLMADTYLKQARYEEQAGKWGAAAASYSKAAEGRPEDAQVCADAARCLRTEGRDLHRAAHFAQLAVQKNPTDAGFRVTLGGIYLDAGLFLRARSELEQATKLDPNNREAKELLARARRLAS